MSNSEFSGDPNPAEPDGLAAAAADHISPDPLLKSGRFIDADVDTDQDQTLGRAQNGDAERTETEGTEPRESSHDKPDMRTSSEADQGGGPTNVPAADTNAESTPSRRSKRALDMASMQERPDWLPDGWELDYRIRSSGASAGTTDKYYVEPVTGRRFRSKKEVFHFIETGGKLKRKPNPDGDAMSSENSGGHRSKKSGSKGKTVSAPPNFNFDNPPEEVSWTLTDASSDTWKPFVGDEKVPEATKLEWDAAFEYLNAKKGNGGNM